MTGERFSPIGEALQVGPFQGALGDVVVPVNENAVGESHALCCQVAGTALNRAHGLDDLDAGRRQEAFCGGKSLVDF
jgi:hypothetical protein